MPQNLLQNHVCSVQELIIFKVPWWTFIDKSVVSQMVLLATLLSPNGFKANCFQLCGLFQSPSARSSHLFMSHFYLEDCHLYQPTSPYSSLHIGKTHYFQENLSYMIRGQQCL